MTTLVVPPSRNHYGIRPLRVGAWQPSEACVRAYNRVEWLMQDYRKHGTFFPPLVWRVLRDLERGVVPAKEA